VSVNAIEVAMKSQSRRSTRPLRRPIKPTRVASAFLQSLPPVLLGSTILALIVWWFISHYTVSLQSPVLLEFQWPLVVSERIASVEAEEARADQHGHSLTAWQQYACRQFGSDCRVALAIQRAENPKGRCEIYHYNSDGTLDWGYFQINTVHLKRPGLNLRDLLDCKANIDFAYQLFQEKHGFSAWSTYNSGKYRQFLDSH
jgi:hypothetical protein